MSDSFEIFVKILGAFSVASSALKNTKDLLPDSSKKKDVDEALRELEKAESEIQLAKIEFAHMVKYELCRNHFPPGIMLSENDKDWTCPDCGNTRDTRRRFVSGVV